MIPTDHGCADTLSLHSVPGYIEVYTRSDSVSLPTDCQRADTLGLYPMPGYINPYTPVLTRHPHQQIVNVLTHQAYTHSVPGYIGLSTWSDSVSIPTDRGCTGTLDLYPVPDYINPYTGGPTQSLHQQVVDV